MLNTSFKPLKNSNDAFGDKIKDQKRLVSG